VRRMAVILVAAVLLLGACGGARTGELQTESQSVELDDAESVRTELRTGFGKLNLSGGAEQLMEANFSYNVAEWEPEVDYDSGRQGTLTVQQGGSDWDSISLLDLGNARNEWDIRLNNGVPIDLSIEMGAGENDLRLGSLSLTALDIQMGAGVAMVDLTGDWDQDLDARIQGGAGEATLRLPRDVGVRVDAEGGIGEINASGLQKDGNTFTNDAYGSSDTTVHIDFQGGVGQVNLEVAD
jgi:N-terminal domain of toast_rack, DUF2154